MRTKYIQVYLLFFSTFLLGSCQGDEITSSEPTDQVSSALENPTIQNLKPFGTVNEIQTFTLIHEKEYSFSLDNQEWNSEEISDLDQESVWKLIQKVISLQGNIMEKETPLEQKSILEFSFVDGKDKEWQTMFFTDEEGDFYVEDKIKDQVWKIDNLPLELQEFMPFYLEPSIDFELGMLEEIMFSKDKLPFYINQQTTTFSKAETAPFVSGWYLHDAFKTEFSVEYKVMEQILTNLLEMKGTKTEKQTSLDENEVVFQIILKDSEKSETLLFGQTDGKMVPLYLKEKQESYEIPVKIVESLDQPPFQLIDNFVALIPLDTLSSVEVKTNENSFLIEAIHEVVMDEAKKSSIFSTFTMNNKKVDESIFRKTYQYIAALRYADVLEEEKPKIKESPEISIHYLFQSEGEMEERMLHFYSIVDENEYVVEKDGVQEFIAEKEQINLMLEQLNDLNAVEE